MTASLSYLPSQYQAETVRVFLIEGTEIAYTDGDPATIKALWTATDHGAQAAAWRGGLEGDGEIKTRIAPFDPKIDAESMTVHLSDPDDYLLGLMHREAYTAGNRTTLRTAIDADDTSIPVQGVGGFAASGAAYVGHERFTYASTTGGGTPTFNTCVRGTFALFQRDGGGDFAQSHGVGTDIFDGGSAADVTDQPRIWLNRRCALYLLHKENGVFVDGGAPLLLWAGRIKNFGAKSPRSVSLQMTALVEVLDSAVFSDQFEGELEPGCWLPARAPETDGAFIRLFTMKTVDGVSDEPLDTGTPTALLESGRYTHQEIAAQIDAQLSSWEDTPSAIWGTGWEIRLIPTDAGPRYRIRCAATFSVTTVHQFKLHLSHRCWAMLGWYEDGEDAAPSYLASDSVSPRRLQPESSTHYSITATHPPLLYYGRLSPRENLALINTKGTYVSQTFTGPLSVGADTTTTGLFAISDYVVGVAGSGAAYTVTTETIGELGSLLGVASDPGGVSIIIPDDGGNRPLRFRQVWIDQRDAADMMLRLLLSTGTAGGYNSATYDVHTTKGIGVGMPYSLVDVPSWKGLAGSIMTLVLDKPRKFSEILEHVLEIKGAHVVFRRGKLGIARPGEPAYGSGDYDLTEDNKAAPEFSTYERTSDAIINQAKVRFNRTIAGSYKGEVTVRSLRSISDFDERKPMTIDAEGVYDGILGVPSGLDEALQTVAQGLAYYGRPLCVVTRTYDFTLLGLAAGDTANLDDEFVPDPSTGGRGVIDWPVWILEQSWNPWADSGKGTVKVAFLPEFAAEQRTKWAPSAEVASSSVGGGFLILNTTSHKYTPSGATATDASYFPAGSKVCLRDASPTDGVGVPYTGLTVGSISGADQITLTSDPTAGAALSTSRRYILGFDDYSTVTAAQQGAHAFIAEATTKRILTLLSSWFRPWMQEAPFESETVTYTTLYRKRLNLADDDGEPHSVGHFIDCHHGINNAYAYRTRQELIGEILDTAITSTSATRTWVYGPIRIPIYSYNRPLTIGALGRCSGGGTVTLRFVLSSGPPRGTTATDLVFPDGGVVYGEVSTASASNVFMTTSTITNPHRSTDGRTPFAWVTVLASRTAGTGTINGLYVWDSAL